MRATLSKNQLKNLSSFKLAKHRREQGIFVAEGAKCVTDLLPHFDLFALVATGERLSDMADALNDSMPLYAATVEQMERLSLRATASDVVAFFRRKESKDVHFKADSLFLILDDVQDPGNFGTIVRIADWYGVETIFASPASADVYNPKVVQATMGSLARVNVIYTPTCDAIALMQKHNVAVYGTFLEGENIYNHSFARSAAVVMGNEGKGISPQTAQLIDCRLHVPSYPAGAPVCDSLNVAVCTGVICHEFRRSENKNTK